MTGRLKKRDERKKDYRKVQRKRVELIEYNEAERLDYVTGFHKRKQEAHKLKVTKAKNRDKEEKRVNVREKRSRLATMAPMVREIDLIAQRPEKVISIETITTETSQTVVKVTEFDPEDY